MKARVLFNSFLVSALLATPLWAADFSQAYPRLVLDRDIQDVVLEFARDMSLLAVTNEEVSGRVSQRDVDMTARQFLSEVVTEVGATWYLSNGVIYVDPMKDLSQRIYDVSGVQQTELLKTFTKLGIDSAQLPSSFGGGSDIAIISGPERFLNMVSEVVFLKGGLALNTPADEEAPGQVEQGNFPTVFIGRASE